MYQGVRIMTIEMVSVIAAEKTAKELRSYAYVNWSLFSEIIINAILAAAETKAIEETLVL